jgi:hypothetical protein
MRSELLTASLLLPHLCSVAVRCFSAPSPVLTGNLGALHAAMSSPKRRKLDASSNDGAAASVQCSSCGAQVSRAISILLSALMRAESPEQSACHVLS